MSYGNCRKTKSSPSKHMKYFNMFRILNVYYNDCDLPYALPIVLCVAGLSIVVGWFGMIRLHGKLTWPYYSLYVIIALGWSFMVTVIIIAAANVCDASTKYYEFLKRKTPSASKTLQKQIRSVRPFGVRIGVLRSVHYYYVFMFYLNLTNYLMSLLIAFPIL